MNWYSWLSKTNLEPSLVYEYGLTFVCNDLQKEDIFYFNHEFLQIMGISIAKHRLEILKLAQKEIRLKPHRFSSLVLAMTKTKKCLTKCIKKMVFYEDSARLGSLICTTDQWKRDIVLVNNKKSSKEPSRKSKDRLALSKCANVEVYGSVTGPMNGPVVKHKNPKVLSWPLDHPTLMLTNGSPNTSGPLEGKRQDKFFFSNKARRGHSGPLERRATTTSNGPLEGRVSRRVSGTLYGKVSPRINGFDGRKSPMLYGGVYNKENVVSNGGIQSIWATMFHDDMKPT